MLARHRDPRITPLELWDLLVDGVPLYRHARDANFGSALARGVAALLDGRAATESGARFPAACRQIGEVVLVGGAAHAVAWPPAPTPIRRAPETVAEQGGLAILARLGARGLVIDLGQSRLKILGARRYVHPRDFTAIPVSQRPVDGRGRAALLTFVAAALRQAADEHSPEALVLALPCELGPDGAPGTCSYPWSAGDPIVADMLTAAGLAHLPGALLNDAELAAIGVAGLTPVDAPTLVLTLGFGVGAALILPDAP